MKACVLAVVVLVALAVLVDCQRPRPPPRPKRCRSTDDCRPDECCQGFPMFGARCKKLLKEGKKCMIGNEFGKLYMMKCPCQEGLQCVPQETKPQDGGGVILINPRCISPNATTTLEEVTTVADISSEEVATSAEQSEESKEE